MLTFDIILQNGETEQEAIDFLNGFCFCDCEEIEQTVTISDSRYICTHEGVSMYYNFVADYYFFSNY